MAESDPAPSSPPLGPAPTAVSSIDRSIYFSLSVPLLFSSLTDRKRHGFVAAEEGGSATRGRKDRGMVDSFSFFSFFFWFDGVVRDLGFCCLISLALSSF